MLGAIFYRIRAHLTSANVTSIKMENAGVHASKTQSVDHYCRNSHEANRVERISKGLSM